MSIQGVDYPWRHPGGAALNAAGKKFAIRYLSHDATKTLMRPEADDLALHGVAVVVVYEDSAQRALDGRTAGVNDATSAMRMVTGKMAGYTDLAMPADRPIYFAVDFDAQWHQVAEYFEGVALTIGKQRVGVYAGLDVVTAARSAGYPWLWQTGAWSHGQWNTHAQLRQLIKTERINGVECDVDIATTDDYGQWTPGGDMISSQDKQDIVNGVVAAITSPRVRDSLALADLWWLEHALAGTTTPSMTAAQKQAIGDIHTAIGALGTK